jgi:hypothetical protein
MGTPCIFFSTPAWRSHTVSIAPHLQSGEKNGPLNLIRRILVPGWEGKYKHAFNAVPF